MAPLLSPGNLGGGLITVNSSIPASGLIGVWGASRLIGSDVNPIVRVRRSSDNAEQDFTEAQILIGSHISFVGTGNGDIVRFYEQSSNSHTLSSQAGTGRFVSSGVATNINGYPFPYVSSPYGNYSFAFNVFPRSLYFVIRLEDNTPRLVSGLIGRNTGIDANPGNHIFVRRNNDYSVSVDGNSAATGKASINNGSFASGGNVSPSGIINYPVATTTVLSVVLDAVTQDSFSQIGSINSGSSIDYSFPGRIAAVVLYAVDTVANGTHGQILDILNSRFGVF